MRRKLLPLLLLATGILTGCSSANLEGKRPVVQAVKPLTEYHPPRPDPITLQDLKLEACESGSKLCLDPDEVNKIARNKIRIARWMGQSNVVINYYDPASRSKSGSKKHKKRK